MGGSGARMEGEIGAYVVMLGKHEENKTLEDPGVDEDIILK
jgi:hypothetical protein